MTTTPIPELAKAAEVPSTPTLLTHLIDVVTHPNPEINAWFADIRDMVTGPDTSSRRLKELTHKGAMAGITQELAVKIFASISKSKGLGWPHYAIRSAVCSVYNTYNQQKAAGPNDPEEMTEVLVPKES